jgi:CheY-like chemotaxis protein
MVVVSDILMPGISGFELCGKVKELKRVAPLILKAAFEINQSEFSMVLPHTTAEGFIRKPISLKKLKELINEIASAAIQELL